MIQQPVYHISIILRSEPGKSEMRYLKFRTLSGERCFKKFSPCVKEEVGLKRLITERNDIGLFT